MRQYCNNIGRNCFVPLLSPEREVTDTKQLDDELASTNSDRNT